MEIDANSNAMNIEETDATATAAATTTATAAIDQIVDAMATTDTPADTTTEPTTKDKGKEKVEEQKIKDEDVPMISLESSDEQVFELRRPVAEMSATIKHMLDDVGSDNVDDEGRAQAIPLPNVDGKVLKLVIEWSNYHFDNPQYETEAEEAHKKAEEERKKDKSKPYVDQGHNFISPWNKTFIESLPSENEIFPLILAANYLDIKTLLDLCCKWVANGLIGLTPEVR